jgi:hypothetical protein
LNSALIRDTTSPYRDGGGERQFVEILGYVVDVALMDKAGITGQFDVKLTSADPRPPMPPQPPTSGPPSTINSDLNSLPSSFRLTFWWWTA